MTLLASLGTVVLLAGCAANAEQPTPLPPAPSATDPAAEPQSGPVQPVGETSDLVTGLSAPWSIAIIDADAALVSERDSALIKLVTSAGEATSIGTVPGVAPGGEGGLLGLAVHAEDTAPTVTWVYAYLTSETDNRIVRMQLRGAAGAYSLGAPMPVLTGIAKAGNHNGGRIAFGPDGMLYATVGDANEVQSAQDPESLNGKILRMTPTGAVPPDNPIAGSLVYSLGHRNPQGLAWDDSGQLWAAEFGQNTWDELNRIRPGANYGWPTVEGIGGDQSFVDPEFQWATDEASPSGLAFGDETFFLAALKGQRVWTIYPGTDRAPVPYFQGQFGRIRDVQVAPDGALWMLTNNTDGRGTPSGGDDRIVRVQLAPLVDG